MSADPAPCRLGCPGNGYYWFRKWWENCLWKYLWKETGYCDYRYTYAGVWWTWTDTQGKRSESGD